MDKVNHSSSLRWDTYAAVGEVESAVGRLLLPDVSELPIEAIVQIRNRTKDVLDPMRAELLRFTEDLRKVVAGAWNDKDLLRNEAENLVATKIEPVVREAAYRTQQLAEQKWRRFYTGVAKAFGLVGASWIHPKLIGKAVAQTLGTGALALGKAEDKSPGPKMTAQFVLQACSVISEKSR